MSSKLQRLGAGVETFMNRVVREPTFVKNPALHVQLTPTAPIVASTTEAVVQAGLYNSCWIRVRSGLTAASLGTLVDEALALKTGPVYVCLPQAIAATPVGGTLLAATLDRRMRFHHFHGHGYGYVLLRTVFHCGIYL